MFEPSIVVLDACVLYPFHLRNIVVQAAVDRLVEARWTDAIHDEWMRNLATAAPPVPLERLQATRRLMTDALPNADFGPDSKPQASMRLRPSRPEIGNNQLHQDMNGILLQ